MKGTGTKKLNISGPGLLVLVRHGESRWNLANQFTGWVDVTLSLNGVREAEKVAEHCRRYNYTATFTSNLVRAQTTLVIILSRQGRSGIFLHESDQSYARGYHKNEQDDIPVFVSSALNERNYGNLQGMPKALAERRFGKKQVSLWRRGYRDAPPGGESLEETHARIHAYITREVLPRAERGEKILLVAHGNTLRAIIKHLEGISDNDISHIDLPKARPLVYEYRQDRFERIEGAYRSDRPLR